MKAISAIAEKHKLCRDRGQRAGDRRLRGEASSRASSPTPSAPASSSRRTSAPSATAARSSPTATTSTPRSAGCATTARSSARCHSYGLQQPPGRHPRRHPERQAEAHHQVDRRRREIAARYTDGLKGTSLTLPYEPAGLPPRLPPVRRRDHAKRDEPARSSSSTAASTPSSTTRSPSTSRKAIPWGKDARSSTARSQRRAERGQLPLAPDVPRADQGRGGLRDRAVRGSGTGRAQMSSLQGRRRRHGQARHAPCRGVPSRTRVSSWSAICDAGSRRGSKGRGRDVGVGAAATDRAGARARRCKPDVFCFCTPPRHPPAS